jgi:hypothetical protein
MADLPVNPPDTTVGPFEYKYEEFEVSQTPEEILSRLNTLGADRWSLVLVTGRPNVTTIYGWFMRKLAV